jgi:hypothetical protein
VGDVFVWINRHFNVSDILLLMWFRDDKYGSHVFVHLVKVSDIEDVILNFNSSFNILLYTELHFYPSTCCVFSRNRFLGMTWFWWTDLTTAPLGMADDAICDQSSASPSNVPIDQFMIHYPHNKCTRSFQRRRHIFLP